MSIQVMSQIWDESTRYSGGELLVLLALADWADKQGRCWPSVPAIAKKSRLSDRQVRYVLRRLIADEAISVITGGGRGNRNVYVINTAKIAAFPKTENPAICDTETLQSDAPKPCNLRQSPEPPNRKNRQGTVKGTVNLPSPTPSEKSEGVRVPDPVDVEIETDRVMRECSFVDQRVRSAISRAMDMHLARGDLDAEATANLMIGNWQEYQRLGEYMRFVWGPAKFFTQGHWVNWELWPIDRERLHRAKEARVGT